MNRLPLKSIPLLFFFVSVKAVAGLIDINSSDFSAGTDVTHAVEGVDLYNVHASTTPGELQFDSVYSVDCLGCRQAVNGSSVFSPYSMSPSQDGYGGYAPQPLFSYEVFFSNWYKRPDSHGPFNQSPEGNVLWVNFDHGTDFVNVTGASGTNFTPFTMDVFDISGNWMASCGYGAIDSRCMGFSDDPNGPFNTSVNYLRTLSFQDAAAEIGFVLVGGGDGPGYVSGIAYNSSPLDVPEPSSFAVMGASLIGLLWFGRRHPDKSQQ